MAKVQPMPLPFAEAKRFWKDKVPTAADEFDELKEKAHAKAFMASGLNQMDQVKAVHSALYKAIADGETFEQFKKRIPDVIRDQNWSGVRLEFIYRTNVQSAYMAGRYAQQSRAVKTRPYWQYSAVNDKRTRPAHAAMHGKIFPADSPVWDTWYPVNGYRCRCTVKSLSERQLKSRGLTVEKEDPTGKLFEPRDKDGNKLPARHLMPDPGFSRNTGKEWLSGLSPAEIAAKDVKWRDAVTKPEKPALSSLKKEEMLPFKEADRLPKNTRPEDAVKAFLGEFGIKNMADGRVIELPGVKLPTAVSKGLFETKDGKLKVNGIQWLKLLARTIADPWEIWMAPGGTGSEVSPWITLIRVFRDESGKPAGAVIFSQSGRQWISETVFPLDEEKIDAFRKGVSLYRAGRNDK